MSDVSRPREFVSYEVVATTHKGPNGSTLCRIYGKRPEGYNVEIDSLYLQEHDRRITELQAELDSWKAQAHADETGHLHRCAKVNGTWQCAKGCAMTRADTAEAALIRIRDGGFVCECAHDDDNCCERVGVWCAVCIAAVALRDLADPVLK